MLPLEKGRVWPCPKCLSNHTNKAHGCSVTALTPLAFCDCPVI